MLGPRKDAKTPVARPSRKALRLLRREELVPLADGDETGALERRERVGVVSPVAQGCHGLGQLVRAAGEHKLAGSGHGLLGGALEQQLRPLVVPQALDALALDQLDRVRPAGTPFGRVTLRARADERERPNSLRRTPRNRQRRV